jgi:peptidyl-prolyl cis-trans isomerase A (cyclophilin A)
MTPHALRLALCLAAIAAAAPAAQQEVPPPGEVLVRLETPFGTIDLAIDEKRAPVTAANFLKYVDGGFYDGGRR